MCRPRGTWPGLHVGLLALPPSRSCHRLSPRSLGSPRAPRLPRGSRCGGPREVGCDVWLSRGHTSRPPPPDCVCTSAGVGVRLLPCWAELRGASLPRGAGSHTRRASRSLSLFSCLSGNSGSQTTRRLFKQWSWVLNSRASPHGARQDPASHPLPSEGFLPSAFTPSRVCRPTGWAAQPPRLGNERGRGVGASAPMVTACPRALAPWGSGCRRRASRAGQQGLNSRSMSGV